MLGQPCIPRWVRCPQVQAGDGGKAELHHSTHRTTERLGCKGSVALQPAPAGCPSPTQAARGSSWHGAPPGMGAGRSTKPSAALPSPRRLPAAQALRAGVCVPAADAVRHGAG